MKIPRFATEEELGDFWDTHSTADYTEEWEEVPLEWEPEEATCRHCGNEMSPVFVDIDFSGKMELRQLETYRCPVCGSFRFSTRALEEIRVLEGRIRRYGLAGMILQNLEYPELVGQ